MLHRNVKEWPTGESYQDCQTMSTLLPNCACSVCIAFTHLTSHAIMYLHIYGPACMPFFALDAPDKVSLQDEQAGLDFHRVEQL